MFGPQSAQSKNLFGGLASSPASAPTGGLFGSTAGAGVGGATTQAGGGGGGLFGGGSAAPAAAGGLFGGSAQPPASAAGGLFGGGSAAPATSGAGGLFGASAAPAAGGLFGASAAPAAGGLFGASAAQPAASLFGQPKKSVMFDLGTQQPATGGFGASALPSSLGSLNQPSSQSQPFAQSQSQSENQGGAYFDAILEKSRRRPHDDDSLGLQLGLGDLRERMRKIGASTPGIPVDGRAHYLLAASGVDPGAAVRDLSFFHQASGRAERTQPEPEADTDVEGYLARLETQTTMNMINEGLERSIRDFDVFLQDNVTIEWGAQRNRIYEHFGIKPKREPASGSFTTSPNNASKAGSQGFGRSARRSGKGAPPSVSRAAGNGASTFGRSSMAKSVIGAAVPIGTVSQPMFTDMEKKGEAKNGMSPGPSERFLREKQSRYIDKVHECNMARKENQKYPLCHELSAVVDKAGENHAKNVIRGYKALAAIVGEDSDLDKLRMNGIKERQYHKAYLDDDPNAPASIALRKQTLRGTQSFLEKEFFEQVEREVKGNPREARIGGIPTATAKIKAYIRLLSFRKNLVADAQELQAVNGDYCWAVIYFLLRSGHVGEASQYVADNNHAFAAIDMNFARCISNFADPTNRDRKLNVGFQENMNNQYNQLSRIAVEGAVDPYRMACYKIIGRCDMTNRFLDSRLTPNQEDFLWLQFALAREYSAVEESARESFGLAALQENMKVLVNNHFARGSAEAAEHFGFAFFVLLASGLFEEAVSWLFYYHETDAVHFAIALDFYGLLRVSDPDIEMTNLMSFTTREKPQITFGRLIGLYTRDFRAANVTAAVDYLILICLNGDLPGEQGRRQVDLCHEALRELILESREFALLLGSIDKSGKKLPGCIEERLKLIRLNDSDAFMKTITLEAAAIADDNGRISDAVLLYHLADEYEKVLTIVNRALGEAIAVPIGHGQIQLQSKSQVSPSSPASPNTSIQTCESPLQLANLIYSMYQNNTAFKNKIRPGHLETCDTLLKMDLCKRLVENREFMTAFDKIIHLDLLPLTARNNMAEIRKCVSTFNNLPAPLMSNIPALILWTLACTAAQHSSLMESRYGADGSNDSHRRQTVEWLKMANADLMAFVGMIRYKLPGHLNEALARAQW